ncbi:MAG TPA: GNAT family N-acetyltransferase [Parachlamydiaceae bacterium]|nr:GNAT family N-acetyltransferase [Parachlamydiaceae bacterium]
MTYIKPIIETNRLILRHWQQEDLEHFVAMNSDPHVMEHFPALKSFDESLKEYHAIAEHFEKNGYGCWAVSEVNKAEFIGFIGLRYIDFLAAFTPTVEVGWRLKYEYWGKGYATEGAKASLNYGFEILRLPEIISFTSTQNLRSRAVMERIGMQPCPNNDFDHPKLPDGHPLRRHIFYRVYRDEWKKSQENYE